MSSLSRRSFLKATGIAAALPLGFSLSACTTSKAGSKSTSSATGLPFDADKVCRVKCGHGDVCGLYHTANVYVKDRVIVGYEGCKEAHNRGALCTRGVNGIQLIYSPHRIKYPMRVVGERGSGKWERISWKEAYTTIAQAIAKAVKEEGPHTVAFHASHTRTQTTWKSSVRFNALFGFSHGGGPVECWNNLKIGAWATLGDYSHFKEEDFLPSKLIVLWGHNPALAMPTEWRDGVMKAKLENDAKIVVIDPYFTASAEKADLVIRLRPGTDAAFALGVANVIINEDLVNHEFVNEHTLGFEEYKKLAMEYPPEKVSEITWVPVEQIKEFARMYATISPAVMEVGRGGNYTAGDSGWLSSRGLTCLIGLTGQVGSPGSGYSVEASTGNPSFTSFWNDWPFATLAEGIKPVIAQKDLTFANANASGFGANQVYTNVLYDGDPFRYRVYITYCDVASKRPDQNRVEEGLSKIPLIVVHNNFINHTANKFADIILPDAFWTEQTMLCAEYTHMVCTPPAVDPMFEGKPTYLMLAELSDYICDELGIVQPENAKFMPHRTSEDIVNAILTNANLPEKGYPNIDYKALCDLPKGMRGARDYNQEGYAFYHEGGDYSKPLQFLTRSGKIEFKCQWLEDEYGLPALPIHKEPTESPISTPELFKEYPLIGNARVHSHWQFLQFCLLEDGGPGSPVSRELFEGAREPLIELNPATAKSYGLREGDMIWAESKYGKLQAKLHVTERCHPGMVVTPHGWGAMQNRLTSPEISLKGGIAIPGVGPYGSGKMWKNQGGQAMYAGFLAKVYKA